MDAELFGTLFRDIRKNRRRTEINDPNYRALFEFYAVLNLNAIEYNSFKHTNIFMS